MTTESTPIENGAARLDGKAAVVVGASRGLGRGVAEAFSAAGAAVFAIARARISTSGRRFCRLAIEIAPLPWARPR